MLGRKVIYPIINGYKTCNCCKQNKEINFFYYDTNRNRYRAECSTCSKDRHNKRYTTEDRRKQDIKKRYNLSIDKWNNLLNLQDNKCAICNKENNSEKNFHTDHCHKTNKVRGLLCKKCNMGIGYFNDSVVILQSAIQYLQKHQIEEEVKELIQ